MIEKTVIDYLNGETDYHIASARPSKMPAELVTVSRTGGGRDELLDFPRVIVHCYAKTEERAARIADDVVEAMMRIPYLIVSHCELDTLSRDPYVVERDGAVSTTPRYTATFRLTCNL